MLNDSQKNKPYHSPRITRIVLRREQAILSTCSSDQSTGVTGKGTDCNGCCGKDNTSPDDLPVS